VADEKVAHESSLESLSTYKQQVKDIQLELFTKEEENKGVHKELQRLQSIINGDTSIIDGDKSEMLKVLQRNAQLEAQLPGLMEQSKLACEAKSAKERAEGAKYAQQAEITKLAEMVSLCLSLRFNGLFLCAGGVLCNVG
tara:strand:- start:54 stop:473 length:420 start_codon:yes stop_codon:yes gene_type:complete